MTDVPKFAPGCFGSALAFNQDNAICKACIFADKCQPLHEENLGRLRAHFGIVPKAEKKPKKEMVSSIGLAVSEKTRQLIDKLDRGSFNVIENLRKGVNPFDRSMPSMMLATHLLIGLNRMNKSLTRPMLAAKYVSALGLKENTADAYARMNIEALIHIGAVENVDGAIRIRRQ